MGLTLLLEVVRDWLSHLNLARLEKLTQLNKELTKIQEPTSNLNSKIKKCTDVVENISKYWRSGSIHQKMAIQKMMFPQGIVLDPKKWQYRTKELNSVFQQVTSIARDTEEQKKDASKNNLDASCLVAGAGLEPTTFGL